MELLDKNLLRYAEQHSAPASDILSRIDRETHAERQDARMVSGHLQGRFLAMMSRLIRPVNALEIGTYTGYSALCIAEGLAPEGKLITIDVNEELRDRVSGYLDDSNLKEKIELKTGKAATIIPQLNVKFDMIFIDADKENYSLYYDLVIDKVNLGGYILADNVLWDGKVIQDDQKDKRTLAIRHFNEKVHSDSRVDHFLLPLRDGIMIARKIHN